MLSDILIFILKGTSIGSWQCRGPQMAKNWHPVAKTARYFIFILLKCEAEQWKVVGAERVRLV